ncbi:TIR domain-containing protein [Micromonospora chalcea]
MPDFYHVRLTERGRQTDEVKLNLTESGLETQILKQYREGSPVTLNGRTIPVQDIERIRISKGDAPAGALIASIEAEDRNFPLTATDRPSKEWRAAARANDVTDQYITGPPGGFAKRTTDGKGAAMTGDDSSADRKSIFLVSGRDTKVSVAITATLRAMGLRVIEWDHAVASTGLPNPYVGDVVMAGMRLARAVLVLMTPDDVVCLREDLAHDDDEGQEREVQGQARPNVFYEAGIADALGRERTILVEVGPSKSFSDISGRHVLRYDGSSAKRNTLAERLRLAGVEPDTSGSHWLSEGKIEDSIAVARSAIRDARARMRPSA